MTSTSSIKCQINQHVFAFYNVAVRFHISIFSFSVKIHQRKVCISM